MVRNFLILVFALAVIAIGTERTTHFVLAMRHGDQQQDARIDELETQLRDVRARLAPPEPAERPVLGDSNDDNAVYGVPVGASPVRGPSDAWVTVVAFLDYQCPYCGRVQTTLEQLQQANPDVRLVVKHHPLPFHNQALPAAIAVECAHEQGDFWAWHRALFDHQRDLEHVLAGTAGIAFNLDAGDMDRCRRGARAASVVADDAALAERMGASGTPSFFINGKKLVGAQPLEAFQRAVDVARIDAKRSGIAAADYYEQGVLARATVR